MEYTNITGSNLMLNLAFKTWIAATSFLVFAQAVPGMGGFTEIGKLEQLGLEGLLLVTVIILARKVERQQEAKEAALIVLQSAKDAALTEKDRLRAEELARRDALLVAKDEHLLEMTKQMTQTLTLQVTTNQAVTAALADSTRVKAEHTRAIELLTERIGRLPGMGVGR